MSHIRLERAPAARLPPHRPTPSSLPPTPIHPAGGFCAPSCSCLNCSNIPSEMAAVQAARDIVLAKNPRAFEVKASQPPQPGPRPGAARMHVHRVTHAPAPWADPPRPVHPLTRMHSLLLSL